MAIYEEKLAFRNDIRNKLAAFSSSQDLYSQQQQAIHKLLQSHLYTKSTAMLVYAATKNEFSLHSLILQAMSDGKILALPKCNPHDCSMNFYQLDNNRPYQEQVSIGSYGILEPALSLPCLEAQQLPESTLVLVPSLALTLRGQRLGKGKGYYDRYLQQIMKRRLLGEPHLSGPILIGVAHSCQIVETIPTEENDVAMDYILTPEGLLAKQE